MGPPDQWQRLTAIVESGFVHADSALELQARAILELEAVDDGLTELLAAWGQYRVTLPRLEQAPEPAIVAPTPIAQPIAA
jgi:hypothetical protein